MSLREFKQFVKNKRNTVLAVAALSANMSFAQAQENTEDRKTDQTEQTAQKMPEYVLGKEVHDGQEFSTVNGNVILGNTDSDLRKDLKEYKKDQKRLFNNAEQDVINTINLKQFLSDDLITGAQYDDMNKRVEYSRFDLGSTEEIAKKLREENPDMSIEQATRTAEQYYNNTQSLNDHESPSFAGLSAHEKQHLNNDKDNIYAPGLNAEQYGKLYQYDEMTANISHLLVLEHKYQELINSGISKEEALKIFDNGPNSQFNFYKEALNKGLEPGSKDAKKLIVNGTCQMWTEKFSEHYASLIQSKIDNYLTANDAGSLAMGNEPEFQRRRDKMFDNLGNNETLKELGIKPGKLSSYLSEKNISLSPELKNYCNNQTLTYTGMTLEQGKTLSEKMPGSPKKDAVNFINILRGKKISNKIRKIFKTQNCQNQNKTYIPDSLQSSGR